MKSLFYWSIWYGTFWDNKVAFQDEIYKNINPDTSKEIIAEINSPNRAMHKISTSANRLPINVLRGNDINKYIMTF